MNYYRISFDDGGESSWALHEVTRRLPKRPKVEGLAPIFYKFFPADRVQVTMKPQYRALCCKTCGRYDADKIFKIGFVDPVTIRFKGDFGHTEDRIFAINDSCLEALDDIGAGGYEAKPLGTSGWHALRVTLLVDCDKKVIKSRKPFCPECGRPRESFGLFEKARELSLPASCNTFFTTRTSWCRHTSDRDYFITEDLLIALKSHGISGGYGVRLLNDEEVRTQKEKEKQGTSFWTPPGVAVRLGRKKKTV